MISFSQIAAPYALYVPLGLFNYLSSTIYPSLAELAFVSEGHANKIISNYNIIVTPHNTILT